MVKQFVGEQLWAERCSCLQMTFNSDLFTTSAAALIPGRLKDSSIDVQREVEKTWFLKVGPACPEPSSWLNTVVWFSDTGGVQNGAELVAKTST